MARASVTQILAAHPTGSFRLGGHCNGGLLAWEIAREREHLGREVDFVALIDVPSLNARLVLRAIAQLIKLIVVVAPNEIGNKFARAMECARSGLMPRGRLFPGMVCTPARSPTIFPQS
jgi:thioesterase domain-containing protein